MLEEAGKLRIVRDDSGHIDCDATNCPFKSIMKVIGVFATDCWIRGKVFDRYVYECCEETLYEDKTREELEYILRSLKEHYGDSPPEERSIKDIYEHARWWFLIKYLETLLSIEEWDGRLVAWF